MTSLACSTAQPSTHAGCATPCAPSKLTVITSFFAFVCAHAWLCKVCECVSVYSLTQLCRYAVRSYQTLLGQASCSPDVTPAGVLYAALQEMNTGFSASCMNTYGMWVGTCAVAEYACFVDPACQQCLAAVYSSYAATADVAVGGGNSSSSSSGSKGDAFRSPSCTTTSPALLSDVNGNCGGDTLPQCTLYKHSCASNPECAPCLDALGAGDGAEAARRCPATQPTANEIEGLVGSCSGSSTTLCGFWQQRCADDEDCSACLAVMGNGDSLRAIAADWSSPACRHVGAISTAGYDGPTRICTHSNAFAKTSLCCA